MQGLSRLCHGRARQATQSTAGEDWTDRNMTDLVDGDHMTVVAALETKSTNDARARHGLQMDGIGGVQQSWCSPHRKIMTELAEVQGGEHLRTEDWQSRLQKTGSEEVRRVIVCAVGGEQTKTKRRTLPVVPSGVVPSGVV